MTTLHLDWLAFDVGRASSLATPTEVATGQPSIGVIVCLRTSSEE